VKPWPSYVTDLLDTIDYNILNGPFKQSWLVIYGAINSHS